MEKNYFAEIDRISNSQEKIQNNLMNDEEMLKNTAILSEYYPIIY